MIELCDDCPEESRQPADPRYRRGPIRRCRACATGVAPIVQPRAAPPAPPAAPTPPLPVVPALSPLRRRELLVTLVGSQPGINVAEAAEVLDCSPKTIGNIARDLHAKGLLDPPVRHPNRYNRLYLHGATPAHLTVSKE